MNYLACLQKNVTRETTGSLAKLAKQLVFSRNNYLSGETTTLLAKQLHTKLMDGQTISGPSRRHILMRVFQNGKCQKSSNSVWTSSHSDCAIVSMIQTGLNQYPSILSRRHAACIFIEYINHSKGECHHRSCSTIVLVVLTEEYNTPLPLFYLGGLWHHISFDSF